jgi:hypothetical protein
MGQRSSLTTFRRGSTMKGLCIAAFAATGISLALIILGNPETISRLCGLQPGEIGIVLVLALCASSYFLPALIAGCRGHQNATAIFATNALLGWTGLGWIVSLIWSLTAVKR